MAKFKNLVFDLGNVIIDIDYEVLVASFQKLVPQDSGMQFGDLLSFAQQQGIFDDLEMGKISPAQFRAEMKRILRPGLQDDDITAAWNTILIDYPKPKFDLLLQLKERYHTLALSNINEMHVEVINQEVKQRFGAKGFSDYFHGLYYSNEMGYRKPQPEIYKMMIEKENLNPAETFFVDDREENVIAATNIGLQAYQLKEREKLSELLKELGII